MKVRKAYEITTTLSEGTSWLLGGYQSEKELIKEYWKEGGKSSDILMERLLGKLKKLRGLMEAS